MKGMDTLRWYGLAMRTNDYDIQRVHENRTEREGLQARSPVKFIKRSILLERE